MGQGDSQRKMTKNKDFKVLFINCNTMMDVLLPVGLSLISACLKEKGFRGEVVRHYLLQDRN